MPLNAFGGENGMPIVGQFVTRITEEGGLVAKFPVNYVYVVQGVTATTVTVLDKNGENPRSFKANRFAPYPVPQLDKRVKNPHQLVGGYVKWGVSLNKVINYDRDTQEFELQYYRIVANRRVKFWDCLGLDGDAVLPAMWPHTPRIGGFVRGRTFFRRRCAYGSAILSTMNVPIGTVLQFSEIRPGEGVYLKDQNGRSWWMSLVDLEIVPEPVNWPFGHDLRRKPVGVPAPVDEWIVGARVALSDLVDLEEDEFDGNDENLPDFIVDNFWNHPIAHIVERRGDGDIKVRLENNQVSGWLERKWFKLVNGVKAAIAGPLPAPKFPFPEDADQFWELSKLQRACAMGSVIDPKDIAHTYDACHAIWVSQFKNEDLEYGYNLCRDPVNKRLLDYVFDKLESPWRSILPYAGYVQFEKPNATPLTVMWLHRNWTLDPNVTNQIAMSFAKVLRIYTEGRAYGQMTDELLDDELIHPGVALFVGQYLKKMPHNRVAEGGGWHGSYLEGNGNLTTLDNFVNARTVDVGIRLPSTSYAGCDRLFNEGANETVICMLKRAAPEVFKAPAKAVGRFGADVEVDKTTVENVKIVCRKISDRLFDDK